MKRVISLVLTAMLFAPAIGANNQAAQTTMEEPELRQLAKWDFSTKTGYDVTDGEGTTKYYTPNAQTLTADITAKWDSINPVIYPAAYYGDQTSYELSFCSQTTADKYKDWIISGSGYFQYKTSSTQNGTDFTNASNHKNYYQFTLSTLGYKKVAMEWNEKCSRNDAAKAWAVHVAYSTDGGTTWKDLGEHALTNNAWTVNGDTLPGGKVSMLVRILPTLDWHYQLQYLTLTGVVGEVDPEDLPAEPMTVASWTFDTGYDAEKSGTTVVYTPNELGYSKLPSTSWSTLQPYFRPNECAAIPEDCYVTVHTSDGKWEMTNSGTTPNYFVRLNTASTDQFTDPDDYADGAKHDQYFEVSMPTTGLRNVKVNFAIGDGSSSGSVFGVVYSTDEGTTWTRLNDYVAGTHWNIYIDSTYTLDANDKTSLIVRMLLQSATATSNYNLKYVNVIADDRVAPTLQSTTPLDDATEALTVGKVILLMSESVRLIGTPTATLTNDVTGAAQTLTPEVKVNKVSFAYDTLALTTAHTFTLPAGSLEDMSGNVFNRDVTLHFTTGDSHPIPSPVLDSHNRLWYHQPATAWEEYLPLGNGRLGAMVSGSVAKDTLQLNEDTFWGQGPNSNHNPNAKTVMAEVQQLIFKGDTASYRQAHELAITNWMSQASHGATYQAAGCVLVGFPDHRFSDEEAGATETARDAQAYVRSLDMNNATTVTSYIVDGVTYTRTVFTSLEDEVTIVRLEASEPDKLNFNVCFAAPRRNEKIGVNLIENGMIKASLVPTHAQTEGVDNVLNCFTYVKVLNDGGTQTTATQTVEQGDLVASGSNVPTIEVANATSATIIISTATNFVNYTDYSADADAKALNYMTTYLDKNKSYETTLADHVKKYQEQFNRVSLDLGHNAVQEAKDTKQRIKEFRAVNGNDPGLVSNYFQFGRYLLISSSQPNTQPANLQGIWNPNARQYPAWDSKYTSNINVEMNYWPAEVTNLSECHEPFIEMVKDISVTGATTAEEMYGARGWMLHHNTDLWRTTGAVDNGPVGVWPTCNAWFCSHLWERYLFSGDETFLAQIYPVLKGCAQFYQDIMIEEPTTHYMVVCPSNSPENHPGIGSYYRDNGSNVKYSLFGGIAMDNQMIYDVLRNTAAAARILNTDTDFANQLDTLRARITPYKIGKYGQVQEWQEDWDSETTAHRHISHLWGAFPGNQVSPYMNDTIFRAAHKSLVGRGDAARGWSIGWKICLWARMLDGDHAFTIIKSLLRFMESDATIADPDGGTYTNFFDAHAPFQIDGNFGACAGIAEMLVQSHAGFVHILPALPSNWQNGEVHGLRTRGGFEITELKWEDGQVTSLKIKSTIGGNLRIRCGNQLKLGDGSALSATNGENPNPLMQPYDLPSPIVVDPTKIPETELPTTYCYDISTTAGEELTLVDINKESPTDDPEEVSNEESAVVAKNQKVIRNNQVLILNQDKTYNTIGQIIK
ncbi:MAG: glycosyl hydrolase family 95 catalytic domain-containing protein [Paludibacteraceae bacterium]